MCRNQNQNDPNGTQKKFSKSKWAKLINSAVADLLGLSWVLLNWCLFSFSLIFLCVINAQTGEEAAGKSIFVVIRALEKSTTQKQEEKEEEEEEKEEDKGEGGRVELINASSLLPWSHPVSHFPHVFSHVSHRPKKLFSLKAQRYAPR